MSDWDDLPEEPATIVPSQSAAIVDDRSRGAQLERIRDLEDQLLATSLEVTADAINFADIAPDQESVPEEWIELLGLEAAQKRFRRMKASWQSAKYAPVGIGVAASTATKIIKARSAEKAAPRALAIVIMNNGGDRVEPVFEVRDVEDE